MVDLHVTRTLTCLFVKISIPTYAYFLFRNIKPLSKFETIHPQNPHPHTHLGVWPKPIFVTSIYPLHVHAIF